MKDFDRFYRENERPFGEKPVKVVGDIPKYLQSGKVFELGAGDGRNSVFLASQGFEVTAQDISSEALKRLTQYSQESGHHISTLLGDATKIEFDKQYEIIVMTYLLHFLPKQDAVDLIQKVKANTKSGGLNALAVVTKESDFFNEDPATNRYFPDKSEVVQLYSDWEVLEHDFVETESNRNNADGTPMRNIGERLLVRKK